MTNKTLLILTLVLRALFLALNIMILNPTKSQNLDQNETVNQKKLVQ